ELSQMCSAFKLLAAAATLARVDAGEERLDRRVRFGAGEVVVNSPITKDRLGGEGMTLAELCEAAMTVSDNTAGNLLLANLGGPAGLTGYARSLGDAVPPVDPIAPGLNQTRPRRPADTRPPGGDAREPARAGARECALRRLARATRALARRQQDRRHSLARRPARRLARGRQDRLRRARHHQRRRRVLAARPRAGDRVDLSHGDDGSFRAEKRHARRGRPRRRVGIALTDRSRREGLHMAKAGHLRRLAPSPTGPVE